MTVGALEVGLDQSPRSPARASAPAARWCDLNTCEARRVVHVLGPRRRLGRRRVRSDGCVMVALVGGPWRVPTDPMLTYC